MIPPLVIPLAWLIAMTMNYLDCVWQTKLQNQRHEALKMLNELEAREKKMTDVEIIRALECHQNTRPTCAECPLYMQPIDCLEQLQRSALVLIRRQQADIERLKKIQQRQADLIIEERGRRYELASKISVLKSEAIKEFAERLRDKACNHLVEYDEGGWSDKVSAVKIDEIDNLVKEMTGGEEVE